MAWVAYQTLHEKLQRAWQGEMGGTDAEAACRRRIVETGLSEPPENPFRNAAFGWRLGSQPFVDDIRQRMQPPQHDEEVSAARTWGNLELETAIAAVAEHEGASVEEFPRRRSNEASRHVAAWLCRRLTTAHCGSWRNDSA